MKSIAVLRTARGLASPVGREEAAERRQRVNSTQALVGRFSRRSAIPSSGDWPCGKEGVESVCLEQGGWDSTTDTWRQVGLRWPPVGAACRSVRLPGSDTSSWSTSWAVSSLHSLAVLFPSGHVWHATLLPIGPRASPDPDLIPHWSA
jgi:hypothetical protein